MGVCNSKQGQTEKADAPVKLAQAGTDAAQVATVVDTPSSKDAQQDATNAKPDAEPVAEPVATPTATSDAKPDPVKVDVNVDADGQVAVKVTDVQVTEKKPEKKLERRASQWVLDGEEWVKAGVPKKERKMVRRASQWTRQGDDWVRIGGETKKTIAPADVPVSSGAIDDNAPVVVDATDAPVDNDATDVPVVVDATDAPVDNDATDVPVVVDATDAPADATDAPVDDDASVDATDVKTPTPDAAAPRVRRVSQWARVDDEWVKKEGDKVVYAPVTKPRNPSRRDSVWEQVNGVWQKAGASQPLSALAEDVKEDDKAEDEIVSENEEVSKAEDVPSETDAPDDAIAQDVSPAPAPAPAPVAAKEMSKEQRRALEILKENNKPWFGFVLAQESHYGNNGLLVLDVKKGSASQTGGLQRGDRILKLNSTHVSTMGEIRAVMSRIKAGDIASVEGIRGNQMRKWTLNLGSRHCSFDRILNLLMVAEDS